MPPSSPESMFPVNPPEMETQGGKSMRRKKSRTTCPFSPPSPCQVVERFGRVSGKFCSSVRNLWCCTSSKYNFSSFSFVPINAIYKGMRHRLCNIIAPRPAQVIRRKGKWTARYMDLYKQRNQIYRRLAALYEPAQTDYRSQCCQTQVKIGKR